jgi:hypothetical protein
VDTAPYSHKDTAPSGVVDTEADFDVLELADGVTLKPRVGEEDLDGDDDGELEYKHTDRMRKFPESDTIREAPNPEPICARPPVPPKLAALPVAST